jgi:hypothetical protein
VATPTAVASPTVLPLGAGFALGVLVQYDEVSGLTDFEPATLPGLGTPDAVYFDAGIPGGNVTMLWRTDGGLVETAIPGVGVLLQQFAGSTSEDQLLGKGLGPGTELESVRVGEARGFWLSGEWHALFYISREGEQERHPLRLVGNTLLWVRDGVTYRLEASITKEEAIRLAETLE